MNHSVDHKWLWDSLRLVIADKASEARARRDVATVEALESIQTTIGRLIEAEKHLHEDPGT